VFHWCREALGVTVNEIFGQTEMNYIVGNSHELWPVKPGSMGRPYPGHRIAVIDDAGNELDAGEVGDVAVHRRWIDGTPDPVFFLGYWGNDPRRRASTPATGAAPATRRRGTRTGISGITGAPTTCSRARAIASARPRSRNCLMRHEAVANSAVVPGARRDARRGDQGVRAARPRLRSSPELEESIRTHVKASLAPYQQPRFIEFVDALPMTTYRESAEEGAARPRGAKGSGTRNQAPGLTGSWLLTTGSYFFWIHRRRESVAVELVLRQSVLDKRLPGEVGHRRRPARVDLVAGEVGKVVENGLVHEAGTPVHASSGVASESTGM
jgi:hypothetical protein